MLDIHRGRFKEGDWTDDTDQMILIMQSITDQEGKVMVITAIILIALDINLFHATGPALFTLKTSENQKLSNVFRSYRKRSVP